jgi:hypothetical protein
MPFIARDQDAGRSDSAEKPAKDAVDRAHAKNAAAACHVMGR